MRALILQHIACEPPGEFEDLLRARGAELPRVELDEGDPLPTSGRDFDLLIAMGGPMSVNDEQEHPWLREEKRLIADAVTANVPFWGACLGVQLLAASLGAAVFPGTSPEVGVLPVTLTDAARDDPVFSELPSQIPTLQWHGDTFDLPEGATLLAGSAAFQHQAFRWGDKAYGVQFHVEVSDTMARDWSMVPAYAEYADRVLGVGALHPLLAAFAAKGDEIRSNGRSMFGRFLERVVAGG
ncbi:MAG: type 1 glutamine amidotransferase [Actinomycetota bacterium]